LKLDWRVKAAAFRIFDSVPGGRYLHYLTQRYVTRTFPRNLSEHDRWQIEHARTFQEHWPGDRATARLFEFGAGWDLHSSLVQWCYGVNDQLSVDLTRLARPEQINHAIDHLRRRPLPGVVRIPEARVSDRFEEELQDHYGIRYAAPFDARATGLPDNSIDLVCTTSVLEHVPPDALRGILQECHRICRDGAVMSHVVDYTDHYAHSDASITPYNFLRFPDGEWERYNPAIHYQNRLRHHQYGELFLAAGFDVLVERAHQPENGETQLRSVPPAPAFQRMTADQLLPGTGHWVLVKNPTGARAD
jgi:SAM-dependent methyltransferase